MELTNNSKQSSFTSLQLKRELQLVRDDKTLTTSQRIAKNRSLWSAYESKFQSND